MSSNTAIATPASSGETNAARFAGLVAAAFNGGDLAAVDGYFQPAFVDHAPWPGQPADVGGFKAGLEEMRTSFPDLQFTVERTVAQDDLLVVHSKMSGSHLGPFMGADPSGKSFKIEAIDILRMEDGRIAEHWGLIDTAGMAEQLGL